MAIESLDDEVKTFRPSLKSDVNWLTFEEGVNEFIIVSPLHHHLVHNYIPVLDGKPKPFRCPGEGCPLCAEAERRWRVYREAKDAGMDEKELRELGKKAGHYTADDEWGCVVWSLDLNEFCLWAFGTTDRERLRTARKVRREKDGLDPDLLPIRRTKIKAGERNKYEMELGTRPVEVEPEVWERAKKFDEAFLDNVFSPPDPEYIRQATGLGEESIPESRSHPLKVPPEVPLSEEEEWDAAPDTTALDDIRVEDINEA